jgi:hypothetical protein
MEKLKYKKPECVGQLYWLIEQIDGKKFISMEECKNKINVSKDIIDESYKVTLGISSLHYFSWLISQAK